MIVAGTGTRKVQLLDDEGREALRSLISNELLVLKPDFVISGGAEGFDTALAVTAWGLSIPYRLMLPNPGYGRYYWHGHSVTGKDHSAGFAWLTQHAESVSYATRSLYVEYEGKRIHSNFYRNQVMVDLADHMLVLKVAERITGGTADCWKRIHAADRPFTVINFGGNGHA